MLIDPNNCSDLSYETLMSRLVVESVGNSQVYDIFRRLLPKAFELVEMLGPAIQRFTHSEDNPEVPPSEFQKTLRKASRANFLSYSPMLVTVPEGFEGKLAPYMKVLLQQGDTLLTNAETFLRDYVTELSVFISNADLRLSQKSNAKIFQRIAAERESYQKVLKSYYKVGSTLSRRPLGKVVDRFSDLDEVFKLSSQLSNFKKQANYTRIADHVKKASELLKLIRERTDSEDISNVSAPVAKNIGEGAYQLAAYVEYLSVHAYSVEVALATVKLLAESIDKLSD